MNPVISPALQALYAGDIDRARTLLAPDDDLPAYEAAAFGRVERLRRLLAEDAGNANAWSPDGFSPLHLAIFGGSEEAVRLLLEHGADVDALATSDIARVRPLGTARFAGRPDLEQLLLEAGADASLAPEEQ
jgi:ankyrin repeat protein